MTPARPSVRPADGPPRSPGRGRAGFTLNAPRAGVTLHPPQAGFTLVEILVVLALMAVLMGIGVSMFTNLGKQGVFSTTVSRVLSTLNRVRNSSMSHPAALQITAGDPGKGEENAVQGIEFVPLWQSQCEEPAKGADPTTLVGALDRNGLLPAGAVFKDGILGKALFLEGGGAVDCGNYSVYDATEGIAIDLWVFPTTLAGGTLVHRGESLTLSLVRQNEGLGVRLDLGFASVGASGKAESSLREGRHFEPKDATLPLQRWSRILVTYDRNHVVLLLDTGRGAVEKLRKEEKAPLSPQPDANLYIGGGGAGGSSFRGGIDDVRIEGVVGSDYTPFAEGVSIQGPTRRIYFRNGKLDGSRHSRPETLILRYGQRERQIVVGMEGNVVSK